MARVLFLVNVILTLPFGVAALAIPAPLFAQFGVALDAGGQLIARGYGATLVGYGIALLFARETTDNGVIRALLLSLAIWNAIEATIQGLAGMQGVATSMIFGNVVMHAVVAVLCFVAWSRHANQSR